MQMSHLYMVRPTCARFTARVDLDQSIDSTVDRLAVFVSPGGPNPSCRRSRGWWRHQDHWNRRLDVTKQRPRGAHLNKALQDPKYRTRLCSHWENSKVGHPIPFDRSVCVYQKSRHKLACSPQRRRVVVIQLCAPFFSPGDVLRIF